VTVPVVDDVHAVAIEDLDVSRPEHFAADTHGPWFARLRREVPVHYCRASAYGPYWSITRYDDILAVEANHRQFSSHGNVIIGDVDPVFDEHRAFATFDPPEHTRDRKAVAPALAPARLASLEAQIRARIGVLLDSLPRNESFDWASRVSAELTTDMVTALFDVPPSERRLLPYWSEVVVTTPGPGAAVATWEERQAVLDQFAARIRQMWHERAHRPDGDDIISVLARHPATAHPTDTPALMIGIVSLIAGANEAARGALSGGVVAFHQFPDEWEKLRADVSLSANAAAEIVRWQSPISHMRRTATEDLVFQGRKIRAGDRVVMWYCSGNRDESRFESPDDFRVDRPNARAHLAYGAGIHRCLGSHAANLQLRILWEEVLTRFPRIELAGEPRRAISNFSASYVELPVRIPWAS
jgi:cytochrome P450